MRAKILFVDDNANILSAIKRTFRREYVVDTAEGGEEGLKKLSSDGPYRVVIADMKMPGMDGIAFLERAEAISPRTARIMLTGNADQKTAVDAVNRGQVYRFLSKPVKVDALRTALEEACKHYEIEQAVLEQAVTGCVKVLTEVLGMVSPLALGRGQHLRKSVALFAKAAGIGQVWEIEVAALLSSIGYVSIPNELLEKLDAQEELSSSEEAMLRSVPQVGHDLLAAVPHLGPVAEIVKYQRKHFNGAGVPNDHISGTALPAGARMLRILEDRLALEMDGIVKKDALHRMRQRVGFYDEALLDVCFEVYPEFLGSTLSHDAPVLCLELGSLKPGHVLISDLRTQGGLLLAESGSCLTAASLQRIRNYAALRQISGPYYVQEERAALV